MKNQRIFTLIVLISLLFSTVSMFAGGWGWTNIGEDIVHKPNFRVIQVYKGQEFSIKWDRYKHGAFIAGDAVVRFRNITDFKDIVGVVNNYQETEGLTIRSTNWVYANVYKSGTLIVYAPFSKEITFTPDIFLSNKNGISAWEINSPDITNNYRVESYFYNSKGKPLFPGYFDSVYLKDEHPINYGKLKRFDNTKIYVVGVNVDSDIISSGPGINYAEYTSGILNKYYFRIFQKEKTSYDRAFANPDLSLDDTTFGLKSVMAVFMISPDCYIDQPKNVYPPSAGYYYEMDNAKDIKDCHFWSYAKFAEPSKYEEIKNYAGYDALFPIGLMKYKIYRYAYPQYFTQADKISKTCAENGTEFYNPVSKQEEIQTLKDGFVKYIYANRFTPIKR